MEALLRVFACHPGSVHEEAMLAVGALTYACGPQFVKYMERFYPILESGLKNYQVRHQAHAGDHCLVSKDLLQQASLKAIKWDDVLLWHDVRALLLE